MPTGLKSLINSAYDEGRYVLSNFRKVPAIAATAGMHVDLSMAPGSPTPNYYLGNELTATVPTNWYRKGIWHGGAVDPYKKYLHKICMFSSGAAMAPAPFYLCDYLMYYPIIDMDSTDTQNFDNTVTLPRYTDGLGVQAFLVATNPYIGGAMFQITYTNSDGVSGRISQLTTTNTATYIGTLVSSNTAMASKNDAFIGLQAGDKGIRSVQSIVFSSANGGLATLVLCRPIATLMTRETTAWAEFDFIKDKPSMPRIYDDAYLNFLVMPSATVAAVPLTGEAWFIWDN